MLIPFIKMHAQGNDFVILDGFSSPLPELPFSILAEQMCRIHTGIGADGLVLLSPCDNAAAKMTIYNSDGSLAEMCGSALRCVSFLTYQKTQLSEFIVNTDSGLKPVFVCAKTGDVTVNLGTPKLKLSNYNAEGITGDLVDIGNLHFVVWQSDLSSNPHLKFGNALEHHSGFPRSVNAHFAKVISPNEIDIKIWERACGPTLACGTGAASVVFSGITKGYISSPVKVNMPGGEVTIIEEGGAYLLSGQVTQVFCGEYLWKA
jgi:diaminopimelate epimerase